MTKQHRNVVVAHDFSRSSEVALDVGLELAAAAPEHVLHILCVIEPSSSYERAEEIQRALTDVIAQRLRGAGIAERVHFYVHTRIGHAADEILMLAAEIGADRIIVGSKPLGGVTRFVLGSVSERVVREAGCTVEVARPKTYGEVVLLDVHEVGKIGHYVPPHRYTYDQTTAALRPDEWPLY
jgi:nucleotide-binding universal stress UspA family protein